MKASALAERLIVAPAGSKGRGVFAGATIPALEHLLWFTGPRIRAAEICDFSHAIRLDFEWFIGASGGIDDLVNHSCDPNAGLRTVGGELELFSLREIPPGEEVTFDYSTCMFEEPSLLECACGSADCRGTIVSFADLPQPLRRRYLSAGAAPDYSVGRGRRRGTIVG